MERLSRLSRDDPAGRGLNFQGGAKEIFHAPDGRIVAAVHTLWWPGGATEDFLYRRENRGHPDAAVRRFFAAAERALLALRGELPTDFAALRDGSDPEVSKLRDEPGPDPDAEGAIPRLRVWVRNDQAMYTGIVGRELIDCDEEFTQGILPLLLEAGASRSWSPEARLALARALAPRGHVALRLPADAVSGEIRTTMGSAAGDRIAGRIAGRLSIRPRRPEDLGSRPNARQDFGLDLEIDGELVVDRDGHRLLDLAMATSRTRLLYSSFIEKEFEAAYAAAVEWVAARPQAVGGKDRDDE